jgi:hypothetical protein
MVEQNLKIDIMLRMVYICFLPYAYFLCIGYEVFIMGELVLIKIERLQVKYG